LFPFYDLSQEAQQTQHKQKGQSDLCLLSGEKNQLSLKSSKNPAKEKIE
jgi:hypothetical protein